MFKLNLKQLIKLLLVTLVIALLLSVLATWADWRVNPSGLFYTGEVIHWSVVWQTLSSWLWPLWLMFLALGYVGMMVVRLVRG
jgi:hypothetical protein